MRAQESIVMIFGNTSSFLTVFPLPDSEKSDSLILPANAARKNLVDVS